MDVPNASLQTAKIGVKKRDKPRVFYTRPNLAHVTAMTAASPNLAMDARRYFERAVELSENEDAPLKMSKMWLELVGQCDCASISEYTHL